MSQRIAIVAAALLWTSGCGCATGGTVGVEEDGDADADSDSDCTPGEPGCPLGPDDDPCFGPEEGCTDWDAEENGNGVAETPEGFLGLDGSASSRHVMWPSSAGNAEVLRVRTDVGEFGDDFVIEAAFWTGPHHGTPEGSNCCAGSGDMPSRSAVDDFGNLLIANRAMISSGAGDDQVASVTKIAADPAACPDVNGNGRVDTSSGWDDKLAFAATDRWDDECILWHTIVGYEYDGTPNGVNAVARAITIKQEFDLDGAFGEYAWVGLFNNDLFQEIDAATGELTGVEAPTPGYSPYGAAIDRDGWIWTTGYDPMYAAIPGRFDTERPEDSFELVPMPEGAVAARVIVDENGAPWFSGTENVHRFDREAWAFEPGIAGGAGMLGNLASDGEGSIWVATYATGEYGYRIDNDEEMAFQRIETPGTLTFGVAADFDGHVWFFGGLPIGMSRWSNATVVDVGTEEKTIALDDCGGHGCLNLPYIRGDITGLQRRNAVTPLGHWTGVVEGCEAETVWGELVVDAMTPPGTSVAVSARTADTLLGLNAAPWVPIGTVPEDGDAFDLGARFEAAGISSGNLLALHVVMRSAGEASPVLRDIAIETACDEAVE